MSITLQVIVELQFDQDCSHEYKTAIEIACARVAENLEAVVAEHIQKDFPTLKIRFH